jgi:hypothetical protein
VTKSRDSTLALLALSAMAAFGGACGRTDLDSLPPLPIGNAIPTVPVFDQSVNVDLDIVFMIDNSGSMREEQANISRNFPTFIAALEALPEGIPNVHIGVLSSDLGAGPFVGVEGCNRVGGDGGIFQARPRAQGGLCTSAPKPGTGNYISSVGAQRNFDGSISDALSCIAELGTNGCGFEHQLASVWRALGGDPSVGVPPQNAGFLRASALLAIVLITDEDDCSAPSDTDLFTPAQQSITDPYGPIDSYRCNEFGHLCNGQPPPRTMAVTNLTNCHSNENGKLLRVADFVSFLQSVKGSPDDVIVAAITGPVSPYSVELVRNQRNGLDELEPRIVPSCTSTNGAAAPAVRIRDFIEGFGTNGTLESICDGDFSPAMARIGDKIAGRIRHQCLSQPPVDRDPVQPGLQAACEVFEQTTTDTGVVRVSIASCDDTAAPPCWRIEPDDTCPGTFSQVVVDRGAVPAAPHTRISVLCETCQDAQDPQCAM